MTEPEHGYHSHDDPSYHTHFMSADEMHHHFYDNGDEDLIDEDEYHWKK